MTTPRSAVVLAAAACPAVLGGCASHAAVMEPGTGLNTPGTSPSTTT